MLSIYFAHRQSTKLLNTHTRFYILFVTVDDTCIHHIRPKSKYQLEHIKHHDSSCPKKERVTP